MRTPWRRLAAPALVMLLTGVATGCTSDGNGERPAAAPPSSSSSSPSATPKPVPTRVTVVNVAGRLPRDARERVRRHVGKVVDRWFDAAYVGGDWPRRDFSHAFPGFTAGARAQAYRDRALMTNQPLASRVDGVTARSKLVWLDVLAAHRHAAAVTARFRLELTTTGSARKQVEVRGRLFLAPGAHGWQVFGYDVSKGTPAELARQDRRAQGHRHGDAQHHHAGGGHGKPHRSSHSSSRQHAKGGGR